MFVDRGHQYAKAPIVEAIIEIQVEPLVEGAFERLAHLVDEDNRYSSDEGHQELFQGQIAFTADSELRGEQQRVGHLFRRGDGQRVIQAHLDRFVYSALPPYEDWEMFCGEMMEEWGHYKSLAAPTSTTRLAVRYVNRIDIPKDCFEVKDYLRTSVELSPYLPQQMSGFFMQVEVPLPAHGVTARITSSNAPAPRDGWGSILLDIDAFVPLSIDLAASSGPDSAIRDTLEVLRDAKNFVFESCITDATRGLID